MNVAVIGGLKLTRLHRFAHGAEFEKLQDDKSYLNRQTCTWDQNANDSPI
jgi:hypothetical protein